ncbi:hypothetical protein QBC37DRAFT_301588, partial [Rhypophila decipiens]
LRGDHGYQVSMFWEGKDTVLLRKFHLDWIVSTWTLLAWLLVNKHSATLDGFHRKRLNRPHVMMNKFRSPECADYKKVAGKIHDFFGKIREGTLLVRADAWIREKCYTEDRLRIERLSGKELPMDRCYINLAIVEGTSENADRSKKESEEKDAALQSSPFSLSARLKVETPDKIIQVELPSLFDEREDSDGKTMQPRRVLIRGRAGVGKTTLCKKMVHGFTTNEFRDWSKLFDRVLWVPLRKLNAWSLTSYNLEDLFCYEYFDQHPNRIILAKELFLTVHSNDQKTLFILDGLDEISQLLDDENPKLSFLQYLLNQPNVIITSRPHVSLPVKFRPPDLELETIGFYRDQVKEYLQATFTDPMKVEEVQSYIEAHQLIGDLVRIPIQLDALCYTWDSFSGETAPQTMTAIYRAIEERLWKKDVLRLGKSDTGELITKDIIKDVEMDQIEHLIDGGVYFLEGLAFTGLCNEVINFDLKHRNAISKEFIPPQKRIYWNKSLPRLSFLRTSDPSADDQSRDYHFLHLTFQEYFAARYFVRQWNAKQPLNYVRLSNGGRNSIEPATFLHEHKYDPRYDIFWRFVAGLLDADGEALGFFQTIEKEPRDLLGPTHQRLVMHSLSEVERKESTFTELRAKLENQLKQWLLFECDFTGSSRLVRETECPEQVLVNALERASEDARQILLKTLSIRTAMPSGVINFVSTWLNNYSSKRLCVATLRTLKHQHKGLPDTILQGVAARLEDEDGDVRRAAVEALQGQSGLPEEILQGIAKRLEHKDGDVRRAAVWALQGQSGLPEEILQGIAKRLEDEDGDVRRAAVEALQCQSGLPEEILQGIAKRLEDEDGDVRWAAVRALQGQSGLPEEILQGIAKRLEHKDGDVCRNITLLSGLPEEILQGIAKRLEDEDEDVRRAAVEALQGQSGLPEEILQGIAKRLEDEDGDVRRAAVKALQGQAVLSLDVLSPYVKPLCKALLQQSFQEHLHWYASDSSFIGVGLRRISLSGRQQSGKEAVVELLSKKGPATAVKDGDQWPPLHLLLGTGRKPW